MKNIPPCGATEEIGRVRGLKDTRWTVYRYDAIAIFMHVCVVDGGKIGKVSATSEAKNHMKYRCTEFRYTK